MHRQLPLMAVLKAFLVLLIRKILLAQQEYGIPFVSADISNIESIIDKKLFTLLFYVLFQKAVDCRYWLSVQRNNLRRLLRSLPAVLLSSAMSFNPMIYLSDVPRDVLRPFYYKKCKKSAEKYW